ncbi:MAG: hypothetical protein HQL75_05315 [Magnetococcales bacterium]|nr:hypothetical protein [Magnetococcales bacterium]
MTHSVFHHPQQRGSLLITTMAFMVFIMILVSSLFSHLLTTEIEAVEDNLTQIRVHWAMVGMMNYTLSRFMKEGQLAPADFLADSDKIVKLNDFMDELNGFTDNTADFTYNEYTVNDTHYTFAVKGAITLGNGNTNDGIDDTGRLDITMTLEDPRDEGGNLLAPTTISPGVRQIRNHIPSMVFELCMRPEPGEPLEVGDDDDNNLTSTCRDSFLKLSTSPDTPGTGSPGESWILEYRREMLP